MTEQLKPCPFCGGSAIVNNGPTYLWYVQCQECRIDGEIRPTKSEAIEAWNRRAQPAQAGDGCVLSNDDMHPAEEIAHLKDLLGKANALARIRAERIKEPEAQAGAEPLDDDTRIGWCMWRIKDLEQQLAAAQKPQPAQAGAEPVAWRGYTITNGYTLHHYYGEAHRVASQIEPLYTHPPARVPLTDDEIEDVWNFLVAKYIEDVDHAYWSRCDFEFARAIEAAHGIGGGK